MEAQATGGRLVAGRVGDGAAAGPADEGTTVSPVGDDRLRLIFTCCHPALALDARIALTLRTIGGLTTPEIAFLLDLIPIAIANFFVAIMLFVYIQP